MRLQADALCEVARHMRDETAPPEWLTLADLRNGYRLSRSAVVAARKRGDLHPSKAGKSMIFLRTEVESMLARRATVTETPPMTSKESPPVSWEEQALMSIRGR
jgi:hypothetical protein